ncbi:uncharacterized protein LOC135163257 isoform X2 [Diachasmimorpha longicaudata]
MLHLEPITTYSPDFDQDMCYAVGNVTQAQRETLMNVEREETMIGDSNRTDNQVQIPIYPEFNQFLGEGMQNEYCYNANAVERSQSPTIVDLRINSYRVGEWSEIEIQKKKRFTDCRGEENDTSVLDYKSYSNIDSSQMIQYESPRLLKKMLQAPVGVNLKQLVNYEDSYDMPNLNNDVFDDSDTLTADSDVNGNDNVIDPNHQHSNNWLGNNTDNIFRTYGEERMDHYEFNCHTYSTDVIENCQKWLANSSSMLSSNGDNNTINIVDNNEYCNQNRIHHSVGVTITNNENSTYYHNTDDQYYNFHLNESNGNQYGYHHQQQSEQQNFEGDINIIEEIGRVETVDTCGVQDSDHQWTSTYAIHRNQGSLEPFYEGSNFICNAEEPQFGFHIRLPEYDESGNERYGQCMRAQYTGETSNVQESERLDDWSRPNLISNEFSSTADNVINYCWPQSSSTENPIIQVPPVNYKLENLLNLEKTSYQGEQLNSDQTCSVYCYTAPIVTQRVLSTPSLASKKNYGGIMEQYMDSDKQASSSLTTNNFPSSNIYAPLMCRPLYSNNLMDLSSQTTCEEATDASNIDVTPAIHTSTWFTEYPAVESGDSTQVYNR